MESLQIHFFMRVEKPELSTLSCCFAVSRQLFALLFWLWKAVEGVRSWLPCSGPAYWLSDTFPCYRAAHATNGSLCRVAQRRAYRMQADAAVVVLCLCFPSDTTFAVSAGAVVAQLGPAIVAQWHELQEAVALVPLSCHVIDSAVSEGKELWLTHRVCHMPISIDCWMQSLTVCILVSE